MIALAVAEWYGPGNLGTIIMTLALGWLAITQPAHHSTLDRRGPMRLTLVHPCVGRRLGQPYIRTWQMEPLAPATLAGLTPRDRDTTIPFLRRSNGGNPVRRAGGSGGAQRGDLHGQARLSHPGD